jgi:hypothetical protein
MKIKKWTGFTRFTGLKPRSRNLVSPVNPVYFALDLICVYLRVSAVSFGITA